MYKAYCLVTAGKQTYKVKAFILKILTFWVWDKTHVSESKCQKKKVGEYFPNLERNYYEHW